MFLEKLVHRLNEVREDKSKINWILKEGIWLQENSTNQQQMCDLILVYKRYAIPVELKGSFDKKNKAIQQIYQGKRFIQENLKLRVPYGKFVVYTGNRYKFENYAGWRLESMAKERGFVMPLNTIDSRV